MKRLLLLATLVTGASAMTAQVAINQPNVLPTTVVNTSRITPNEPGTKIKGADGKVQATQGWSSWFTPESHGNNHYTPALIAMMDVLKYDVTTKNLLLARNMLTSVNPPYATQLGWQVASASSNYATSSFIPATESPAPGFFGRPNFVYIKSGSTPADWPNAFYGIQWDDQGANGKFSYELHLPSGDHITQVQDAAGPAPGYTYGHRDLEIEPNSTSIVSVATSGLPENSSVQYGAYDFQNYRMNDEDFLTQNQPAAWGLSKWRDPGVLNSSYNTRPIVGVDSEGNIYTAFQNMLAGTETDRTVQVSKSTDGGLTWSATMEVLPKSTIDAALLALGKDFFAQYYRMAYRDGAFVVTGVDQYSYFYRVIASEKYSNGDSLRNFKNYILEARHNAGVWSVNVAAEIPYLPGTPAGVDADVDAFFTYDIVQDPFKTGDSASIYVTQEPSNMGSEINIAKTADGKHLIMKYVALDTNQPVTFDTPVKSVSTTDQGKTYVEAPEITGMFPSEVYFSYRDINSATWETAKSSMQATRDDAFNWRTLMPEIVESINDVPVVQMINPRTASLTSQLPKLMGETVLGNTSVEARKFDLENLVLPSSVNEEATYNFNFGTISPNPSMGLSQMAFTLDQPSFVSVDLVDVVGNVIRNLASQRMDAGAMGVNITTTDLASGTYFVALTVDGKRLMKPLVVIK